MNHVLYATDKNYCEVCAVSLYSLLSKLSSNVVIHIVESNLEDKKEDLIRVAEMFDQEIEFISIDRISTILSSRGIPSFRGGYATYARFFSGDFIDDGKIIYLDCDTVITGDLAPLFDFDLQGNPYGAVIDQCSSYVNYLIGHKMTDKYFNSGVLLIDNKMVKEQNMSELFVEASKTINFKNTFIGADQDIMNVAFYRRITTLPVNYNMMYTTRVFSGRCCLMQATKAYDTYYTPEEFDKARKDIKVIHFAGGGKYQPWKEEGVSFSKEEAMMWSEIYEHLYPDGKYSSVVKNQKGRKPPKFPALYSFTKGFLRNIRLLPKLIKAKF